MNAPRPKNAGGRTTRVRFSEIPEAVRSALRHNQRYAAFSFAFYENLRWRKQNPSPLVQPPPELIRGDLEILLSAAGKSDDKKLLETLSEYTGKSNEFLYDFLRDSKERDAPIHLEAFDFPMAKKIFNAMGHTAKTLIPDISSSKIPSTNLWSRYAEGALLAIAFNKWLVPQLIHHHIKKSCKPYRIEMQIDHTTFSADYHVMAERVVVLAAWQKRCPDMPDHLTSENAPSFLPLVKEAIISFWFGSKDGEGYYRAAQTKIRWDGTSTEAQKRDGALQQICNAVRSIAKMGK